MALSFMTRYRKWIIKSAISNHHGSINWHRVGCDDCFCLWWCRWSEAYRQSLVLILRDGQRLVLLPLLMVKCQKCGMDMLLEQLAALSQSHFLDQ